MNCNGIDDDCNGTNDEDYISVATSCGIGACASTGATSCVNGGVQDSCTPGTPAPNDTTAMALMKTAMAPTMKIMFPLSRIVGLELALQKEQHLVSMAENKIAVCLGFLLQRFSLQ